MPWRNSHARVVDAMLAGDGLPECGTDLVTLLHINNSPNSCSSSLNIRIGRFGGVPVQNNVSFVALKTQIRSGRCVDAGPQHASIRSRPVSNSRFRA